MVVTVVTVATLVTACQLHSADRGDSGPNGLTDTRFEGQLSYKKFGPTNFVGHNCEPILSLALQICRTKLASSFWPYQIISQNDKPKFSEK
jgi:hypothetical protein